jgi:hypothetical protein
LTKETLAENLHLLNIDQIPTAARKKLWTAPQKPDKTEEEESKKTQDESESEEDDDSSESDSSQSSSSNESDSDSEDSEEEETQTTTQPSHKVSKEEDDDIIILSDDDDDDKILNDNYDIAAPTETTYHVACYMTRDTTPKRTLASYDLFTSFITSANTTHFLTTRITSTSKQKRKGKY